MLHVFWRIFFEIFLQNLAEGPMGPNMSWNLVFDFGEELALNKIREILSNAPKTRS